MPFKKGSFYSLRQCHPVAVKYRGGDVIPSPFFTPEDLTILIYMCHWKPMNIEVTIMPPFQPNEYLWKTHADKGTEKW